MALRKTTHADGDASRGKEPENRDLGLAQDGTLTQNLGLGRTRAVRPSEKEKYVYCPAAYAFEQEGKEPDWVSWYKLRGTIFHEAIRGHKSFTDIYNETLLAAGPDIRKHGFSISDSFLATEKSRLLRWTGAYKKEIDRRHIVILDREVELSYEVIGVPHQCHIDALAIHPTTPEGFVEIHDYKTGNKWQPPALNRKVQFADYWYAATQNGYKVNRVWWGHAQDLVRAKGAFLYPILITAEDIPYIEDYTRRFLVATGAKAYPYNSYGPNSPCGGCEYNESCPSLAYGCETPGEENE